MKYIFILSSLILSSSFGVAVPKQMQEEFNRDQAMLLQKKNTLGTVGVNPQQKGMTFVKPGKPINEYALYQDLIEKYESHDRYGFQEKFKQLLVQYHNGSYVDEAHYLAGMISLTDKKYGVALRNFNKIIEEYPKSEKKIEALFAKGIVLKRMNLNSQALKVFSYLKKRYPASVEAERADTEIKILRM